MEMMENRFIEPSDALLYGLGPTGNELRINDN